MFSSVAEQNRDMVETGTEETVMLVDTHCVMFAKLS